MRHLPICLLIFICASKTAAGIKCYNCVSRVGDDCEHVGINHVTPCNPLPHHSFSPVCVKKVLRDLEGNITISRQCIQSGQTEQECEAPSINYQVISCSICGTDLCNSAIEINFIGNILLGLMVATFLYLFIPNI